jgi:HEAT repeat protein
LFQISHATRLEVWTKNLNHTNDIIRKNAAIHLGKLNDNKAILPLIKALENEANTKVKIEIIKSLGRLGDETTLNILRENYLKEQTQIVAKTYLRIIGILEQRLEYEKKKTKSSN